MVTQHTSILDAFLRPEQQWEKYDGPIAEEVVARMLNIATDAIQAELSNHQIKGVLHGVLLGYEIADGQETDPTGSYGYQWGDTSIYQNAQKLPVEHLEQEEIDREIEILPLDFMIDLANKINEKLRIELEQIRPAQPKFIHTHICGQIKLYREDSHWEASQPDKVIGTSGCCRRRSDNRRALKFLRSNGTPICHGGILCS